MELKKTQLEVIRAVLSRAKCWGTFAQQTSVPALCCQGHCWPVPLEGDWGGSTAPLHSRGDT